MKRRELELAVGRAERAEEALRQIAGIQPFVVEYIRREGFVFATPADKPDAKRTKAEMWEKLAFSIYTDLCEVESIARRVLET